MQYKGYQTLCGSTKNLAEKATGRWNMEKAGELHKMNILSIQALQKSSQQILR